jgi:hypothetical protein
MNFSTLQSIRQALGLEANDYSRDSEIESMSPDRQFELYCQWEGLLGGWHIKLREVVLDLFREEKL